MDILYGDDLIDPIQTLMPVPCDLPHYCGPLLTLHCYYIVGQVTTCMLLLLLGRRTHICYWKLLLHYWDPAQPALLLNYWPMARGSPAIDYSATSRPPWPPQTRQLLARNDHAAVYRLRYARWRWLHVCLHVVAFVVASSPPLTFLPATPAAACGAACDIALPCFHLQRTISSLTHATTYTFV